MKYSVRITFIKTNIFVAFCGTNIISTETSFQRMNSTSLNLCLIQIWLPISFIFLTVSTPPMVPQKGLYQPKQVFVSKDRPPKSGTSQTGDSTRHELQMITWGSQGLKVLIEIQLFEIKSTFLRNHINITRRILLKTKIITFIKPYTHESHHCRKTLSQLVIIVIQRKSEQKTNIDQKEQRCQW